MERRKMEDETNNREKKMIIKKSLSKSISSPSRTEKFPPPLMRFLRSNIGSKSRGKSRSSPMMFMRKKNSNSSSVIITTQEPSSPKVTCIGQVRVRRSSKSKNKDFLRTPSHKQPKRFNSSSSTTNVKYNQTPCVWVQKALCCNNVFPKFHKPRSISLFLRKWVSFFCCGYCKKVDSKEHCSSSKVESLPRSFHNHGNEEAQEEESKQDIADSNSTPPKNAFLLTRCRSAPYRSSSLANRFWGSPTKDEEDEEKSDVEEQEQEQEQELELEQEEVEEVKVEPRFSSQSEEMERSSIDERNCKVAKSIQDLRAIGGAAVHPLILTRCKSEPARRGERLNPDDTQESQPCD